MNQGADVPQAAIDCAAEILAGETTEPHEYARAVIDALVAGGHYTPSNGDGYWMWVERAEAAEATVEALQDSLDAIEDLDIMKTERDHALRQHVLIADAYKAERARGDAAVALLRWAIRHVPLYEGDKFASDLAMQERVRAFLETEGKR